MRACKLATLRGLDAVWAMQPGGSGHRNGPRRSMSITKLKTLGSWEPPRWRDGAPGEEPTRFRGRIITGMLTGGDPDADDAAAEPGEARSR